MFEKLFISILNMSISASYVILIVIFLRFMMKKLPKVYAYILWSVVWVRLINPFKIESIFSLVHINAQTIPTDIGYAKNPAINSGILVLNQSINKSLPPATPYASVNPMQIHLFIGRTIWLWGLVVLVLYMIFSVIKMHTKLRTAVHLFDNVYETDAFGSPFVFGNRIYLTTSLDLLERDYILTHEQIHIKRRDHIIKPVVFLIACVHWFNPLVWVAYTLMERDMELSCDESVINHAGNEIKTSYSKSLLAFAGKNRILGGCPFTFGEKTTVKRIKHILSYKRPTLWVMIIAFIAICILGISLITTSVKSASEPDLSFLNPENLITSVYDQEIIKIDEVEMGGYTRVSGAEIGKWINQIYWNERKMKSPLELTPTYVLMNLLGQESESEIRLYASDPTLAMVVYEGKWRYYDITEADYKALQMLVMVRSYFEPYGSTEMGQGEANITHVGVEVVDVNIDMLFEKLMASPKTSSNPNDYIEANPEVFKAILAYEDEALSYCFLNFKSGDQLGLKGYLMATVAANLCEGEFNYEFSNGQAWYEHYITYAIAKRSELGAEEFYKYMPKSYLLLSIYEGKKDKLETIRIPDYEYSGQDPYLALVYKTDLQNQVNTKTGSEFRVSAARVHEVSKEENQIKIFATIRSDSYSLNGNEVMEESGSVFPMALTFKVEADGGFTLLKSEFTRDGSEFIKSIDQFCVTPVSGKKIKGLSKKILDHYSDYGDLNTLQMNNLKEHLLKYDLHGIVLITEYDNTRTPLTD